MKVNSSEGDFFLFDGREFVKNGHEDRHRRKDGSTKYAVVDVSPVAHAVAGHRGLAVATPVSRVAVASGRRATVLHRPQAVAVAGPGGLALAHSALYLYTTHRSVSYLAYYGSGKGQYLEVTRDAAGTVLRERIVSEEEADKENITKTDKEGNLLAKVVAANLHTLRSQAGSLLKLHTKARSVGQLRQNERMQYRNQLLTLRETAAELVKLVEEVGEDVDVLFKKNKYGQYEEDVGEEGLAIETPGAPDTELSELSDVLGGATVAEAKPVGLAVVGENGVAASRPQATAVAASGLALARPVATAIAGLDPAALGIVFNINPTAKH